MRILLVDDEPLILETLGAFLDMSGHQVLCAKAASEAMHLLEQHRGEVDVLLSDVCMPGENGPDLLSQMRETYPDIDAVLMTGYAESLDTHGALEEGASAFLRKPVKMVDLEVVLQQIEDRRKDRTKIRRLDRSLATERLFRKETEQDRRFARRLHATIFPRDFSWLRRTDVHLRHLPMAGIGGDYADLRPYGDGQALILVADVSGHGTPAAFGGIALKTWFATVDLGLSPAQVIAQGDAMMSDIFPEEFYATAFCAIYQERGHRLQYVVAGHPPPVCLSSEHGPRLLAGDGAPMGMRLGVERSQQETVLHEGEVLLIYSDGLSEESQQILRVAQALPMSGPIELADVSQQFLDQTIAQNPLRAFADDLTMLLLAPRLPRPPDFRTLPDRRICVVSEHEQVALVLLRHGAQVSRLGSCAEAPESGLQADLLVLDSALVHDLRACILASRQRNARLPLLVLLSEQAQHLVHALIELGNVSFCRLPASDGELVRAVEYALNVDPETDVVTFEQLANDWFDFVISSSPAAVDLLSRYLEALARQPIPAEVLDDLVYCVRELATNAIEWGNLHDPDLYVRVSTVLLQDQVLVKIADEGGGFDTRHLFDPEQLEADQERRQRLGKRDGGFGLGIVQSMMDRVVFNSRGNVVMLVKQFQSGGASS
jgi:phosphoserine phosphatase RsbU/P